MATPVKDAAWLEWMANLMGMAPRQNLTAMLPPEKFHCVLDDLPLHLIPVSTPSCKARQDSPTPGSRLTLDPTCSVLPAGELPDELKDRRDLVAGFFLQWPVAWVKDACTGLLNPFWLGPECESAIGKLRDGEAAESLPKEVCGVLADAGILVSEDYTTRITGYWRGIKETGPQAFRINNYVPLRRLIHPFHVAALRRYYRYAIRKGSIRLGDNQSERRYVAHNEPVARYFHHQIAGIVSAVVGELVKPSYVYLASYLSGAELKRHTDREQCEFSVTLSLDFSPEPQVVNPWPIRLDTAQGDVAVYQALGDGLIYRGTSVPHYREALGEGCTSTSLFFHYVPSDFSGSLD